MRLQFLYLPFLFITLTAAAQKDIRSFEINLPQQKVARANYASLRLIDLRVDTVTYGIVRYGAFKKWALVVMKPSLRKQLSSMMDAMVDSTAEKEELVLLLRQFTVGESVGQLGERGHCHVRAEMFGSSKGLYHKLATIDSVFSRASLDATNGLLDLAGDVFPDLIGHFLVATAMDTAFYTIDDLARIDEIEKDRMPVYNTSEYKQGAYKTFHSFVQQKPDMDDLKMAFWKNTGNAKWVEFKNKKGKYEAGLVSDWYAFVYEGKIYIRSETGTLPVMKKNRDFYFAGDLAKIQWSKWRAAENIYFLSSMGALNDVGRPVTFVLKVSHSTGRFVQGLE